jgi:hypothetical protein
MNKGFLFDTGLSDPLESIAYGLALEALRVGESDNPSDLEISACVEASILVAIQCHPDLARGPIDAHRMLDNVVRAIHGLRDAYLLAAEAKGTA